jgi:hypothetical protein
MSSNEARGPELVEEYAPEDEPPLAGYLVVTGSFVGSIVGFEAVRRRRGWKLPSHVSIEDVGLLALATFKLSRIVTKERVTGAFRAPFTRFEGRAGPAEVSETPRGTGLRRVIGELIVCPYCVAHWVAAGFIAGYIRNPRAARSVAAVFAVVALSDALNRGWTPK